MIQERDIREQLAAHLAGKVSLGAFERWLAANSWNMFNEASPDAIRLVAALNLLVSELHDRIINDQQFRDELLPLLNNVAVSSPVDFGQDEHPSWSIRGSIKSENWSPQISPGVAA